MNTLFSTSVSARITLLRSIIIIAYGGAEDPERGVEARGAGARGEGRGKVGRAVSSAGVQRLCHIKIKENL